MEEEVGGGKGKKMWGVAEDAGRDFIKDGVVDINRKFGLLMGSAVYFFKHKTAYENSACLVGSEMCMRDRCHKVAEAL